ncbi:MAG: glycosyltransferase family 2 protein [Cyanobacteria bacterium J06641_5]
MDAKVGLVAIGRNEGDRLRRCLESAVGAVEQLVYVDSGSTDGSPEMARSLGVDVVDLDLSVPFTAARSRNAGFARLQELLPEVEFVQFVDGDCEIAGGWLQLAVATLQEKQEVAVVCGRRRERFPEASPYNRLCDLEWDTPVGEALACGGDSMMRVSALSAVKGFNPSLIAGEEPELCLRLRQQDWKILRLDAEMTLHDAAMTRFGQWWKRMARAGHAFAEGAWLHGKTPERYNVKETQRIWLWGAVIPAIALVSLWPSQGWSLALLLVYPLMVLKVFMSQIRATVPSQDAALYALSCTIGKFPSIAGVLQFHANRLQGKRSQLIEYK